MSSSNNNSNIRSELKALHNQANKVLEEEIKENEAKKVKTDTKNQGTVELPVDEWAAKADEAVSIKFIHNESDVESDPGSFRPTFTHQVFKDEKINGYKGLSVKLYYTPAATSCYLAVKYTESRPAVLCDNISQILGKHLINHKPVSSLDEFIKLAKNEHTTFKPIGEKVDTYTVDHTSSNNSSNNNNNQEGEVTYEIYKNTFDDARVRSYHKRVQTFVLFFIDASSYIDDEDPAWEIYFTFEKRVIAGGEIHYSLVGYCTVYNFYAYPDRFRKRVSQFLILPPFQRKGHGARLLKAIYKSADTVKVRDFTVEDPSIDFEHLRDVVDIQNLLAAGFFKERPLSDEVEKETIKEIQEKLKLTPEQIKHCHEILLFRDVDTGDEEEYKAYRLRVKRRLYQVYQDILADCATPEEKKQKLAEYYTETEQQYKAVLKKALGTI